MAPTSTIADRFNIMQGGLPKAVVGLDVQSLLNCDVGGNCTGGDPVKVYEYAKKKGLVDSSCMNYLGTELDKLKCDQVDICRDCHAPIPTVNQTLLENCYPVTSTKYYVSDYKHLSGAD